MALGASRADYSTRRENNIKASNPMFFSLLHVKN